MSAFMLHFLGSTQETFLCEGPRMMDNTVCVKCPFHAVFQKYVDQRNYDPS